MPSLSDVNKEKYCTMLVSFLAA